MLQDVGHQPDSYSNVGTPCKPLSARARRGHSARTTWRAALRLALDSTGASPRGLFRRYGGNGLLRHIQVLARWIFADLLPGHIRRPDRSTEVTRHHVPMSLTHEHLRRDNHPATRCVACVLHLSTFLHELAPRTRSHHCPQRQRYLSIAFQPGSGHLCSVLMTRTPLRNRPTSP